MSFVNDVTFHFCRLISPITDEKQLPAVVSPLADAELCDVVALAQKALSASKQAALLADDTEANPSDNTGDSLSTRLLFKTLFVYLINLLLAGYYVKIFVNLDVWF